MAKGPLSLAVLVVDFFLSLILGFVFMDLRDINFGPFNFSFY